MAAETCNRRHRNPKSPMSKCLISPNESLAVTLQSIRSRQRRGGATALDSLGQSKVSSYPRGELFVAPDLGVRGRPQSSKKKKLPDNFCSQSLMEFALLILMPVIVRVSPECDLQLLEELVHAREQGLGRVGSGLHTGAALEHYHPVCQVGGHDEIVLDNEASLLSVQDEPLNHLGRHQPLLRVQVGAGLINKVDIGRLAKTKSQGNSLQLTTRKVLNLLVYDVINLERSHDIGDELRVNISVPDSVVQKLSSGSLMLGRDLLGLEGDVEGWHLSRAAVRLQLTSHHPDECGLASSVLAEQDQNLAVRELALCHIDLERAEGFGHGRVVVAGHPLHLLLRSVLAHLELQSILSESQVLRGHKSIQEDVDAFSDRKGHGDNPVGTRDAIQHADIVREVVENAQVVLNDDDELIALQQVPDRASSVQPLLHIEVGAGLVEHEDVGILDAHHGAGEPLKLSSGQVLDVSVLQLILLVKQTLNTALDGAGNLVDILRLNHSLEVIFQDLGEIVLKLAPPEVGQNLCPIRRLLITSQIGLLLARQDLQGGGLSDTIGANKPENFARPWDGQPVQLEGVGGVSVGGALVQVGGQVNDGHRLERTLLHTDAATDAQTF